MDEKSRQKRFDALSEVGCAICGRPPQIHHLIGIAHRGMGQKAGDEYTIPLCMDHHTGPEGIHTLGKRAWESKYGDQEYLLDVTNLKIEMLLQIQKHGYVDVESFEQNNE
jgi:hypothetical protein